MWAGLPSHSSPLIPASQRRFMRSSSARCEPRSPRAVCGPAIGSDRASTRCRIADQREHRRARVRRARASRGARNAPRSRIVRCRVAARRAAARRTQPPASGIHDPCAGRGWRAPVSHLTTCCERLARIARKEHDRGRCYSSRPGSQTPGTRARTSSRLAILLACAGAGVLLTVATDNPGPVIVLVARRDRR